MLCEELQFARRTEDAVDIGVVFGLEHLEVVETLDDPHY